jgi:chorismate-pyruvate lyase
MTSIRRTAELLFPLDRFYAAQGTELPSIEQIESNELPQPYRSLLAHDRDMTSSLERHFGQGLHLRVLGLRRSAEVLRREVVLLTDEDKRAVEFGAIEIQLSPFDQSPREQILAARLPFGLILRRFGIVHRSRPSAYLVLESEPVIAGALELKKPSRLYGRHNQLFDDRDRLLAEVVEILPPLEDERDGAARDGLSS